MCILSYLPSGIEPDIDGLFNGGVLNGDGHGWAIVADDASHVIVGKSMDLLTALDDFETARKQNMRGPAMFHSRWATHGTTDVSNVHPFDVGGSALTVVAHNGILSRCTPGKGDSRSDTRLFADDILSTRYRRLDKARAFQALTDFIGSGNKLVILTADPRYRRNAYIVNEKAGNWDKETGHWHSNHDYLGTPRWSKSYGYGTGYTGGKGKQVATTYVVGKREQSTTLGRAAAHWYDECAICQFGNVDASGYCTECGTCSDCLESKADCLCFQRHDFTVSAADYDDDRELETAAVADIQERFDRMLRNTTQEDYERIFGYDAYDD